MATLYVGTSAGAFATINEAIAAANNGDTIIVKGSEYTLTNEKVSITKPVTLEAEGTVVVDQFGISSSTKPLEVSIDGFTVKPTVCAVASNRTCGVYLGIANVTNLVITNCDFDLTSPAAGTTGYGIHLDLNFSDTEKVTIDGCTFTGDGNLVTSAVRASYMSSVEFTNNTVTNVSGHAVQLSLTGPYDGYTGDAKVKISGNDISNVGGMGIYSADYGNDNTAVEITDNNFSNIQLAGAHEYGAVIRIGAPTVSGLTITGNNINGANAGIYQNAIIKDGSAGTVDISGNSFILNDGVSYASGAALKASAVNSYDSATGTVTSVLPPDNELIIGTDVPGVADTTTLIVDGAFAGLEEGMYVGVGDKGYTIGTNAFGSFVEALKSVTADTTGIKLYGDIVESATSDSIKVTMSKDLTISGGKVTWSSGSSWVWFVKADDVEAANLTFDDFVLDGNNSKVFYFGDKVTAIVESGASISMYNGAAQAGSTVIVKEGGKFFNLKEAFQVQASGDLKAQFIVEGKEGFKAADATLDDRQAYIKYTNVDGKVEVTDSFYAAYDYINVRNAGEFTADNSLIQIGADAGNTWHYNPVGNGLGQLKVSGDAVVNITNGSILKASGHITNSATINVDKATVIADGNLVSNGVVPPASNKGAITNSGTITVTDSTFTANIIDNTGTITVTDSTFTAGGAVNVGADASFTVSGDSSINVANLASGRITILDGTTLTDSTITGAGTARIEAGTVTFKGDNVIASLGGGISAPYGVTLVVEKDASLVLSRSGFVWGYDRHITVNGSIVDATSYADVAALEAAGVKLSLKSDSGSGFSVGGDGTNNVNVTDAYVEFDNTSWKNAYGTYVWNFKNSYVHATSFGNNNAGKSGASLVATFDDSRLDAKNYIKTGAGMTYKFINGSIATAASLRIDGGLDIDATSSVTVTAYQNNSKGKQDEHGDISGTVNVSGTLDIKASGNLGIELLGGEVNIDGGTLNANKNDIILDAASELKVTNNGTLISEGKIDNSGKVTLTDTEFAFGTIDNKGEVLATGNVTLALDNVTGNAVTLDKAVMSDSEIGGNVLVSGDTTISGTAAVSGVTKVANGATLTIAAGATYTGANLAAGNDTYFGFGENADDAKGGTIDIYGNVKVNQVNADGNGIVYVRDKATLDSAEFCVENGNIDGATRGAVNVAGTVKTASLRIFSGGEVEVTGTGTIVADHADNVSVQQDINIWGGGKLNINGGTVTVAESMTVSSDSKVVVNGGNFTVKETFNNQGGDSTDVKGESTLNIKTVSGSSINLYDGAIIKDSTVGGAVCVVGDVTFRGKNVISQLTDYGTYYAEDYGANAKWTVEKGASLELSKIYGLGYGDDANVIGSLTDAKAAYTAGLTRDDASLIINNSFITQNNSAGKGTSNSFTVTDAYVRISKDGADQSLKNHASDTYGQYQFTFTNSVIDVNSFKFTSSAAGTDGKYDFTITDSVFVTGGDFFFDDAESTFAASNSIIKATGNVNNAATVGGKLDLTGGAVFETGKAIVNTGAITMDATSKITAAAISGAGTITIDAKNYTGESVKLIDLSQNTALSGITLKNATNKYYLTYEADGDVVLSQCPEYVYVSSDYNSSTEGWGVTRFANYASAYAFTNAKAKKATIVMEKTVTVSGNCSEKNDTGVAAVIVKDGAVLGNANSKWDAVFALTLEGGGILQTVRPFTAVSYGNTHVKNKWIIGDGSDKQAQIKFINGPGIAYKTGSIALLSGLNRSITANNALIEVGDFGIQSTASFTDTELVVDGVMAIRGTSLAKTTFKDSTVTIKGHNYMNEPTYYSTVGTILSTATLDNTKITVDDKSDTSAAETVWLGYTGNVAQTLALTNNSSITVEKDTLVKVADKVTLTDSSITAGTVDAGETAYAGTNNFNFNQLEKGKVYYAVIYDSEGNELETIERTSTSGSTFSPKFSALPAGSYRAVCYSDAEKTQIHQEKTYTFAGIGTLDLTNSKLTAENIKLAGGNASMDINSKVTFGSVESGYFTVKDAADYVDNAGVSDGTYYLFDYTGNGTMTVDDYKTILNGVWHDNYKVIGNDLFLTDQTADTVYVNSAWNGMKFGETTSEGYVYGYNATAAVADVASMIATDGSDTTVKFLSDVNSEQTVDFNYGSGDITFTADAPVTIKQTILGSDWIFQKGEKNTITVGKNVTFEVYDNASGFNVFYGPSLKVEGSITGGQNWGCLYLFNGDHTVESTGTVAVGRIQAGFSTLTVNGDAADTRTDAHIDTNYLLVEAGTFTAKDAVIEAGAIHDSNNGQMRYGASEFEFNNSKVTADSLTLGYADSTVSISGGQFSATTVTNAGTITVTGTSTVNIGTLTGNYLRFEESTLTGDSTVGGNIRTYESFVLDGTLKGVKQTNMYDTATFKAGSEFEGGNTIVGSGASFTLENTAKLSARFFNVLGTAEINGEIILDHSDPRQKLLQGHEGGIINLNTGAVFTVSGHNAILNAGSTLNVKGGTLNITKRDQYADDITRGGALYNNSEVNVSAGKLAGSRIENTGNINITGGEVDMAKEVVLSEIITIDGFTAGEARDIQVVFSREGGESSTITVSVEKDKTSVSLNTQDFADGNYTVTFIDGSNVVNTSAVVTNGKISVTNGKFSAGTLTLGNGSFDVYGESTVNVGTLNGTAIYGHDATLVDSTIGGTYRVYGTENKITGTSKITGITGVGWGNSYAKEQVALTILGDFEGTNTLVGSTSNFDHQLYIGQADADRTTAYFGQLGGFGDVTINNADVSYGYTFLRNDVAVTNATFTATSVNTYVSGNAVVVVDNSTWDVTKGQLDVGSYGADYMTGNADVTVKGSSTVKAGTIRLENTDDSDYTVKFAVDGSTVEAGKIWVGAEAEFTVSGNVTVKTPKFTGILNVADGTVFSNDTAITVNGGSVIAAGSVTLKVDSIQGADNFTAKSVNFTGVTLPTDQVITVYSGATSFDALAINGYNVANGQAYIDGVIYNVVASDTAITVEKAAGVEYDPIEFTINGVTQVANSYEFVFDLTVSGGNGEYVYDITAKDSVTGETISGSTNGKSFIFDAPATGNAVDFTIGVSDTFGKHTEVTANTVSGVVDYTAPVLSNVAETVDGAKLSLSWNASDNFGVVGYTVTVNGEEFSIIGADTTVFDYTAAVSGVYSYTVSAYDAAGNKVITDAANAELYVSMTVDSLALNQIKGEQAFTVDAAVSGGLGAYTYSYAVTDAAGNAIDFVLDGSKLSVADTVKSINVAVTVTDEKGISITESISSAVVDYVDPELEVTGNAASWTNAAVTLTAAGSDNFGEYTVEYQIGNGAWQTGSSAVVNSNCDVLFKVTDAAGNFVYSTVTVDKIDTAAPAFTVTGITGAWTAADVELGIYATDDLSGVNSIEYSFDNASWSAVDSGKVAVSANGTVYFKVTDVAGNVTVDSVEVANIDKTAPEITLAADKTHLTGNVTITASAADSASGIASLQYSLNGTDWKVYTSGVKVYNNSTVYFKATDNVGNVSVSDITIDNISDIRSNLLDNGCSQIVAWDAERGAVGYVANAGTPGAEWKGVWEWSGDDAAMWRVAAVGNFGDTVNDKDGILLYNGSNNTFAAWTDLGSGDYGYKSLLYVESDFNTKCIANLDGDGIDDVIIYNSTGSFGAVLNATEYRDIWHVDELKTHEVIGAGFFGEADNRDSLVVKNLLANTYELWHNNGDIRTTWAWDTTFVTTVNADWEIAAIGDFQGDGIDDIVMWQKSTGYMYAWENGKSDETRWVGALDNSDWEVAAVGDYNGDGKEDLLLRELVSGWGGLGIWGGAYAGNWTDLNARVESDNNGSKFGVIA